MKKHLLIAGVVGASVMAITAKSSDPEIMKVGNMSVPLSEFEYLYHKNANQQLTPQPLEEYVGMFADYKMKVADAVEAGLDTTDAFRSEFKKFKKDLSEPYFRDQASLDSLTELIFDRMQKDVLVSHIMVAEDNSRLLDSIATLIKSGKLPFEMAARRFSIDKSTAPRGGLMGLVVPLRYPIAFEDAAYALQPGEISPVVNSGLGLHLIRVESITPAKGEVRASHILRLTRNRTPEQQAAARTTIDSIYTVLTQNPEKFDELAKEFCQDGSAPKGGDLGWFGSGAMVAEFDSVAFALPEGAISEPFQTQFGWHIVKKTGERKFTSLEKDRERIVAAINRSKLADIPSKRFMEKQQARYGVKWHKDNYDSIAAPIIARDGHLDESLIDFFHTCQLPVITVDGQTFTVAQLSANGKFGGHDGTHDIMGYLLHLAEYKMLDIVTELSENEIMERDTEYANLVKEYRDGILLFDISNTKVWDKANKDTEGLEAFFRANKANYKWDSPKFKSYIIFAQNDSILDRAMDFAANLPAVLSPTEFSEKFKKEFGRDIRVERVIAAKGENAITDYLGFGAEKPAPQGKWTIYRAFGGRVLEQPEEAMDVRGAVVADYQNALEKAWLDELHTRYPVTVNKKVLKKVK